MLLDTHYDGVKLYREEKIVYARFPAPHRVISTCPVAGGLRDDLTFLYNHQSCEPNRHDLPFTRLASKERVDARAAEVGGNSPGTLWNFRSGLYGKDLFPP
jgi:hypothetical protein